MVYDPKKPPQIVNMPFDPKKDSKKLVNMPYNPATDYKPMVPFLNQGNAQPTMQNQTYGATATNAPSFSATATATAAPQSLEDKYKTNIEGLARYNNVDMGAAKDMFISNLTAGGQYKGGGILDYNKAAPDVQAYVSAKAQPSFTPPPSANDTAKAQVDAELAKMIGSINQGYDRQHQSNLGLVDANKQYLESQIAKLRDNQAQDNNSAQSLQNRRGGFYSGGLDYQLGTIGKGYAEAQGGLQKDVLARNNEILGRDRLLAEQAADQISQLQQQAPSMVSKLIQDNLDKADQTALQKSQTLGTYVDPRAEPLLKTIFAAKLANKYGGNQAAGDAAKEARDQLPMYNIDPALFGPDVSYEQAVQNYRKIGTSTLQKRQVDFTQNVEFPWKQAVTQQDADLKAQDLAHKIGYDWATLDQHTKEALANLAIAQQNANTSSSNSQINRDEFELRKAGQNQKDTNSQATNVAISEAMKYGSYEEAVNALKQHSSDMAAAGVDINQVLDALGRRFGKLPAQNPNLPLE